MSKRIVLLLIVLYAGILRGQNTVPISLSLYGGYTFQDHLNLGYYNGYTDNGYIKAAGQYGAGLEFFLNRWRALEITYQYMGTHAPFYDYFGQTNKGSDKASINYILVGGNNYFPTHSNFLPYGGIGIGVGIASFDYNGNGSTTVTKFAWNMKLGVKIKTQSMVSIKLQAYLQSIVDGVGVGVGFGTGGAGAGVTTYSSMLQFGLGGGLCFDFGEKFKK